ncbi:MAG: nickel ABC transporter permease subunit NikB [Deltaproteobacteria bacterium]|jgi:nickel transport system permease protein|nr:nickel ABC transporter permease subunit NikB [Deltaproteobacteria bacterium]
MLKLIIKRLLMLIPLMFFVSVVVFLVLRLSPNDPAMSYLRLSNIPPSEEALRIARADLGLDRPLVTQYIDWAAKAIRLDFGVSYVTRTSVMRQLLHYLPNTLYLASVTMLITLAFSIPFGVLAAVNRGRLIDKLSRVLAYIGVSTPSFWLAFLMIILFSVKLGWLPSMGLGGISYVVMPACSVALMSLCINMRLTRGCMLEQLHARHVLYARIRGVTEKRIIRGHVLRNSMIPVVTALGMHVGEVLGGAVVAEVIFAWPGVGRYMISAISNRDFPVMQCFIIMMTGIFVVCNLLTDIMCAGLDPRARLVGEEGPHE